MNTPTGFVFVTLYHIHWQNVTDYQDFYLPIYRCRNNNDRVLLDSQGDILAFTEISFAHLAKELCHDKCRDFPDPLISFPHAAGIGELVPGDAVEVLMGSALSALTGRCDKSYPDLLEVLSVVDEIFHILGSDHKGKVYQESEFLGVVARVSTSLIEKRTVSATFTDDAAVESFALELEKAIRFMAAKIRIVSNGSIGSDK